MRVPIVSKLCLAAATAALVSTVASPAQADCGDFGRMGVGLSALMVTLPSIVAGTFGAPGFALIGDGSLPYWHGVGWAAAATLTGAGTGTAVVAPTCLEPHYIYLPGALALGGSVISTTIWGLTAGGGNEPEDPPVAVGASVTPGPPDGAPTWTFTAQGRF